MDEYLVKCWVKIRACDRMNAETLVDCILDNCYISGWLSDYKILDVIRADEVTASWEM